MRKTYNGFKNYETWATNLWLKNNQEYYNLAKSMDSADELGEFLESILDEVGLPFMFMGFLNSAYDEVDLRELFESIKGVN